MIFIINDQNSWKLIKKLITVLTSILIRFIRSILEFYPIEAYKFYIKNDLHYNSKIFV